MELSTDHEFRTQALAIGAGETAEQATVATRLDTGPPRKDLFNRLPVLWSLRVLVLACVVGVWQLIVTLGLFDKTLTSSPSAVGSYLWHALGSSEMWTALQATMTAVIIAFGLAGTVGIAIGITLALLPKFERVVAPFIDALNAMPRVALAPVFVVAFGLSIQAKIALAFSIVVFIVLSAARAGVRSVDFDVARIATILGANRRQMFAKIMIPVAIPSIFGGLRLGLIYSLLGVVTAEIIGSSDGVGQLLQLYASQFQIDRVYGLLVILAVVASILSTVMTAAERRLLSWQAPSDRP